MGRAIDMENDISALRLRVEKLESIVRGMTHELDALDEKSTKTEHVDLVEDVKEDDNGKKKTNNKRNGKSSKQSNNGNKKSSK